MTYLPIGYVQSKMIRLPINLNKDWNNTINSLETINETIQFIETDDRSTKDEVFRLRSILNTKPTLYARQCSVTEDGMNEGWCWGDGLFYTKSYETTIIELRKDYPDKKDLTDDELLTLAVEVDERLYYTEWECEEDMQYAEIGGTLYDVDLLVTMKEGIDKTFNS